jgi:hypothetical protein
MAHFGIPFLRQVGYLLNAPRKTVRWPMLNNYNLINVATNNAFIVFRYRHAITKEQFLQQLTIELCRKHVLRRSMKMKSETYRWAQGLNFYVQEKLSPHITSRPNGAVRRCAFCGKQTRSFCATCSEAIGRRHRKQVKSELCNNC